jgi:CDP-diacylglycerol--glycerol-3-phosphate 3-phosphatidyltransferase
MLSPPNQLTLLRIFLTPIFAGLLFSENPTFKQFAVGVFILAAITDWYDGWVARRYGYITRLGKFFDPLADKILTSTAFISFIAIGYAPGWMVWTIVVRDFVITFLRSYAEYKNKPIDTSRFAQIKTLFQIVVIYVILLAYVIRSSPDLYIILGSWVDRLASHDIVYGLMLVTTLITLWTGILYIIHNWKILKLLFITNARVTEIE